MGVAHLITPRSTRRGRIQIHQILGGLFVNRLCLGLDVRPLTSSGRPARRTAVFIELHCASVRFPRPAFRLTPSYDEGSGISNGNCRFSAVCPQTCAASPLVTTGWASAGRPGLDSLFPLLVPRKR